MSFAARLPIYWRNSVDFLSHHQQSGFVSLLSLLAIAKVLYTATDQSMGIDGGFYLDVARHVQQGQGLKSMVSLYHLGVETFPYESSIYPLWPWTLGTASHLLPLSVAAKLLPALLFGLSIYLAFVLGQRMHPTLHPGLRWHGGHLLALGLGLHGAYFISTSRPYTEGLAYALFLLAALRFSDHLRRPRLWHGVEMGVWLGIGLLVRSQQVLMVGAFGLAMVSVLFVWGARRTVGYSILAALAFVVVLTPQVLHLHHLAGDWPTAWKSLIHFDAVRSGELSAVQLMAHDESLWAYVLTRLKGVAFSMALGHKLSYTRTMMVVIYCLPIAAVVAVKQRSMTSLRRVIQNPLWVFVFGFGLLGFLAVHHTHKAYYTEWHFARRHAIPVVFLLYFGVVFLIKSGPRLRAVALTLLIASTAINGIDFLNRGVISIGGLRKDTKTYRALQSWYETNIRSEGVHVMGYNDNVGTRFIWRIPNVAGRWMFEGTTHQEAQTMLKLGMDSLVLHRTKDRPEFLQRTEWLAQNFVHVTAIGDYDVYRRRSG